MAQRILMKSSFKNHHFHNSEIQKVCIIPKKETHYQKIYNFPELITNPYPLQDVIFRWISIDGMMHGSQILEKRTHKPIFWKKFALFNPFEFQKLQSESHYKEHNSMIFGNLNGHDRSKHHQ